MILCATLVLADTLACFNHFNMAGDYCPNKVIAAPEEHCFNNEKELHI